MRYLHEKGMPWRIIWDTGEASFHTYASRYQAEWASKRPDAYFEDRAASSITEDQWLSSMRRCVTLEKALPDLAAKATTRADYLARRTVRK